MITGAGSPNGIGFETAKILGELGGKILLVATTERFFSELKSCVALALKQKVSLRISWTMQVENLVAGIIQKYGVIHVLVNNAGMVQVGMEEDFATFDKVTYDSWDDAIDRNLNTCFN